MERYVNFSDCIPVTARRLREADINLIADRIVTEFVSIPYYDAAIPCGSPSDIGYVEDGGYIRLPKDLIGKVHGVISVTARGDSMVDAGIMDGDCLTVQLTKDVRDGDIIVAALDGDMTCKVFYRQASGCTMLLPRNSDYAPIVLEDGNYGRIDILGVVTKIVHPAQHTPYRICSDIAASYERTQKQQREQHPPVPSDETVADALRRIHPHVRCGRHWYAVLRVLMDCGYYVRGDYRGFVEDLQMWLGKDFKPQPTAHDLSKMCVQSFSKPLAQWNRNDAPVQDKRFDDYRNIANEFKEMIA